MFVFVWSQMHEVYERVATPRTNESTDIDRIHFGETVYASLFL